MRKVKPGRHAARLAFRTRLAVFISAGIVLGGLALILFLNLSLQRSLAIKPALLAITPKTAYVQMLEYNPDAIAAQRKKLLHLTTISKVAPAPQKVVTPSLSQPPPDSNYTVQVLPAGQYDHLWSAEIARRLTGYSLLSVGILAVLAFFASYLLSRRAMRPLTEMARVADSLSADDLTPRLAQRGPRDEISRLTAGFNGMLDRLQSAFGEMERFNAFASHELRNALALVRTHLEVGMASGDHRQALSDALAATARLSRVVDDILALSLPLESARTEPVDLALAAAEAADAYQRPGRRLELDLPEEGISPVRGHAAWLQRAVANLLDNAFKYGPEDGPVSVKVEQRQGVAIVSVADRGPGIPPEMRGRIWKSFYRLDPGQRQQGSGLGLALVKHAVEAAGGRVWVESTPGEGSTFYLKVPVEGKSHSRLPSTADLE